MRIPAFDLSRQTRQLEPELREAIAEVALSGQFILGPAVSRFEQTFGEAFGVNAIGVANGSDALYLALRALDIGPGDEVITTPFTFFATAGSVLRTGAHPVFTDIQLDTFNMDPVEASAHVSPRTRAMLPVHLFGLMVDVDTLRARFGGPVIEDAAQAVGARFHGQWAGAVGDMAGFSFFPTKNLGAWGDAGMVTTKIPELADKVRMFRVHGSRQKYHHEALGINSRLDTLQAAVLSVKWTYWPEWTARRQALAARYTAYLKDLGVSEVVPPTIPSEAEHVFHQYTIRADRRDALKAYLHDQGIGSTVYYPLPLHLQPVLQDLGYREGQFPHAEEASRTVLSLPMFPELTEDEVVQVVETIARFYGHGGTR